MKLLKKGSALMERGVCPDGVFMNEKYLKSIRVIMVLFYAALFCFLAKNSFASVKLSISPEDGGNTIRFGRIDDPSRYNKEVRFRITSTGGQQYQVFQRVLSSFVNQSGDFLGRQIIRSSASESSNMLGTLYLQSEEFVGFSDQLIYTSTIDGKDDQFVLFYNIDSQSVAKFGEFTGSILYSIRPIGGAQLDEVVINISLESSAEFNVTVQSSFGQNVVRLTTKEEDQFEGYLKLFYEGNRSRALNFSQRILQFPVDESNNFLDEKVIEFGVSKSNFGALDLQDWTQFKRQQTQLYSSSQSEGELFIHYRLNKEYLDSQKSGEYRAMLQLTVENNDIREVIDIDLIVKIESIFEITVSEPKDGMRFSKLIPQMEPQVKELLVHVKSNLNVPYSVDQKIQDYLINEDGEEFDSKFFKIKQELVSGFTGEIQYPNFQSVPKGSVPIFFSDKQGLSSKFKVYYQVNPYVRMKPGNYHMAVVYSFGEI